jgi:glyoxalase family protein
MNARTLHATHMARIVPSVFNNVRTVFHPVSGGRVTLDGIHHITALASDPQRNIDFYVGFLGLRLVKKTVNFDAPDVYHFYYGDETGRPGTMLTFFPFPNATKGKRGVDEIVSVAFSIPPGSMDYWVDRLASHGLHFDGPVERFGETVISFEDPDGMMLELVVDERAGLIPPWDGSAVDSVHAPRTLHGATLAESNLDVTAEFLTQGLGFTAAKSDGERFRYHVGNGRAMATIDVLHLPKAAPARQSAGSVHHIAWRVADDATQLAWREILTEARVHATHVRERMYFRSVYFHEPGGVLFELATDGPGMLIDEPLADLGSQLKLPPWLEAERDRLERLLVPVSLPRVAVK